MSTDLFHRPSVADDGDRNVYDFYPTPAWMTRSLLRWHPSIIGECVLEPCSGDGAITRVLRAEDCLVATNDIDPRHEADTHDDATTAEFWRTAPTVDWIVTNPPFNVAFPILQFALEHAIEGVAVVLRKSWLEPTRERGEWLQAHPPTRLICQPRHSFRGKGSDSVASDWHIWERRPNRALPPIVIDHLAKLRGCDA